MEYLFKRLIVTLASMQCLYFTRIEEKLEVYDLNMSNDSHTDGAWNGW